MDLGLFIRERRQARGWTQTELAGEAGVGLNFVYQLEKNKATVQLDCTRQVLRALGYDLAVAPLAPSFDLPIGGTARALPWD